MDKLSTSFRSCGRRDSDNKGSSRMIWDVTNSSSELQQRDIHMGGEPLSTSHTLRTTKLAHRKGIQYVLFSQTQQVHSFGTHLTI